MLSDVGLLVSDRRPGVVADVERRGSVVRRGEMRVTVARGDEMRSGVMRRDEVRAANRGDEANSGAGLTLFARSAAARASTRTRSL
jgi:hypothetical protein